MKTCWIITDGSAGMVNQCMGLALALSDKIPLSIREKVIKVKAPWKWFAPYLHLGIDRALESSSSDLSPPFPDIIFSCGRQSIAPAIDVKKRSTGKTKIVHIQNPVISSNYFDAIIVPLHDQLVKSNTIQTLGAPHKITNEVLEKSKANFPIFAKISPHDKRLGILIGGACKAYPMDDRTIDSLIQSLKSLIKQGYRLFISPSRRTPEALQNRLKRDILKNNESSVYLWDMVSENPYFAILASADALIVTCDSVCMITEACVTDKPVYLFPLKGGNKKFNLFHSALENKNQIQWYYPGASLDLTPKLPYIEVEDTINKLRELIQI